jgi:hypothetical protein
MSGANTFNGYMPRFYLAENDPTVSSPVVYVILSNTETNAPLTRTDLPGRTLVPAVRLQFNRAATDESWVTTTRVYLEDTGQQR